jgi:cyclic beta-1,2-glucan synthetase
MANEAELHNDPTLRDTFRQWADRYRRAVEQHAWDGAWYIRAYFDDGAPLGSQHSDEAKIDAIAQSWSIISGAGDPAHQQQAMQSLEQKLVREDARLIKLLTPPFDKTSHDPGYIKGYLPGVRENGAQYTHGALWAVLATALQGRGTRAFELFQLLNPITHAADRERVETYQVEPYVVAADVYTAEGHLGRGGWTWYTGSASWMYRVGIEGIAGLCKRGDTLLMNPCIPASWDQLSLTYRHKSATYVIQITNPSHVERGVRTVTVDGAAQADQRIPLTDDGATHQVVIEMGVVSAT